VHDCFFLSRPPLNDRILPRNRLVFRLEVVRYNDGTEQLLDCYSAGSSLFAKQRVCLFAEGHHDLIRRFFFNLSSFRISRRTFRNLYSTYDGARHIRITENPPQILAKIRKKASSHQLHLIPDSQRSVVSCQGPFRAAHAVESSP
jgi:hypothetical protein